jgi:hypothetical protein
MTQQNSALVEESAAAAESLKDQARRLSGLVDSFRVTDAPAAARPAAQAPARQAIVRASQSSKAVVAQKPKPPAARAPQAPQAPRAAAAAPAAQAAPAKAADDGDWETF